MSWRVRAARAADLPALMDLARLTGGGFTNLPADEAALAERLALSDASFARREDAPDNELYTLLLEHTGSAGDAAAATARIGGCAMVFSRIGARWPFYSYKIGVLSQTSKALGQTFSLPFLSLVTDHDGASEVGGLFLHPDLRTGGPGSGGQGSGSLGRLLARSRYLFVAQHRARFGDRMLAELRGVLDDDGNSPFWEAIGAKFFGMGFTEADRFNSVNGNQFIADLMPKHPIYIALLPEAARAVIGQPHPKGRPALAMLEAEGFHYDNYVDIFDGGPTVTARTDSLRSIRDARLMPVDRLCPTGDGFARSLVATGRLAEFRAWIGRVGDAALPAGEAALMGVAVGDEVRHVAF
ncbi:MAG: arginine N-succinyltransferase [Sandarakinorhabdus sp.]|nr:arginine N-succinyltransferase [Sandarakinorhabdus sp.]